MAVSFEGDARTRSQRITRRGADDRLLFLVDDDGTHHAALPESDWMRDLGRTVTALCGARVTNAMASSPYPLAWPDRVAAEVCGTCSHHYRQQRSKGIR